MFAPASLCCGLWVAAALALDAQAGEIFKCVDGGATSYQSLPCERGQGATRMNIANAATPALQGVRVASSPVPAPRKRSPWSRETVEPGMSDDEVLNMPGWGRPARIARTRLPQGWEEVWAYGDRFRGERELRFMNARLKDIIESPAAQASAR